MKARINPLIRRAVAIAIPIATTGVIHAADLDWVGDVDSDFQKGANWESDPSMPNSAADIHRFKNNGAPTTVTNVSIALSNTGTSAGTNLGQILFEGTAPAFTLQGGTISLPSSIHNNAITLSTGSTVTQTIASNLVIGDGSAATSSVVNSSTDGGLLKFTGNISGGTGAVTPGAVSFGFGNTSSHNGNYEATGNITKGDATAINITKRGTGTLTLSGTNEVTSLGQNEAGSKIVIAAGTTSIKPASETTNNWGGNAVATSIEVKTGATLNADYARSIRTKLSVTGGTVNIQTTAPRLDWGLTNTEVFNMTGGEVNYLNASSGTQYGVAFTSNSGTQSGGTFTVNGRGAIQQTFSVTASSANGGYSLSGGTLDVKGSNGSNGWIRLSADTAGTYLSTFTLSDTGKLISRFNPGASSGGIVGENSGAKQILSLQGGTLVAGRIDATNLRGSEAGTNGTLVNNGTTFAPGDVGTVGRTNIIGNMSVSTGMLTIDLSGVAASSAFSEAANLGTFDNLLISGDLSLGGTLGLNLVNGYTPQSTDVFKIIDIGGTLSNFFTNVSDGGTLATLGNQGTFKVYSSGNDVFLSNFTAVPEPRAALLGGLGLLALLRRRR